jgi:electron transfer flavoprotein alpha subunit
MWCVCGVAVAGKNCKAVADQVAKLEGVKKVLVAENPAYEHGLAEDLAPLVANYTKKEEYTHVLAPASAWGKNLTPRIAGILDITALSDVISVESQDTFKCVDARLCLLVYVASRAYRRSLSLSL